MIPIPAIIIIVLGVSICAYLIIRLCVEENKMTNKEAKHTCGRCQYENVPDQEYPCNRCIWSKDVRQDLWTLKENSKSESEEENE